MHAKTFPEKRLMTVVSSAIILLCLFILQSCKKSEDLSTPEEIIFAGKKRGNPHNPPPPPPPPPPYFSDCYNPVYGPVFVKGVATNITFTKSYINSPGGSYPAFTSANANGITITAPAGTLNVGTGTITFTATGTPVNAGYGNVTIGVGGINCMLNYTVMNPPVSGPNADPGTAPGSTGIVNFTYKGQAVAYQTVRAKDGKIWLQQNLGAPQVAFSHYDEASYGDYFQWGRWDDGHQAANSPVITGGSSILNPSNISAGYPKFIVGQTSATRWWGTGGMATDTWSGSTATATNGKDPCAALGAGWRVPTAADWQNVKNYEDLEGAMAAHMSNLRLPAAGYRDAYGGFVYSGGESYYWSSTATGIYATGIFISDNTYAATLHSTERGQGYNCRCVKN